jgi:hypothetical protein
MAAANVSLEIDQGEDWTAQIVWTDDFDEPYNIVHPCRLDIKTLAGATQLSLETTAAAPPLGSPIPEILVSSDIGMLQLHIEDTVTAAMLPGLYQYDLFVTVDDGNEYAGTQVQRILAGMVTVNKRVTVM